MGVGGGLASSVIFRGIDEESYIASRILIRHVIIEELNFKAMIRRKQ